MILNIPLKASWTGRGRLISKDVKSLPKVKKSLPLTLFPPDLDTL